jgi:hypothetical protein
MAARRNRGAALVRLALVATIVFSVYNLLTYFFIYFIGQPFSTAVSLSLLTQLALTVLVFLLLRMDSEKLLKARFVNAVSLLWVATYFLNVYVWISSFGVSNFYWTIQDAFFGAFGIPTFPDGAPLGGLFHSADEDALGNNQWVFDWGVNFSWLLFNISTVLLMGMMMYRYLNSGLVDFDGLRGAHPMPPNLDEFCNCESPLANARGACSRCSHKLNREQLSGMTGSPEMNSSDSACQICANPILQGQKFCPSCGVQISQKPLSSADLQEVECNQCGADLEQGQKFCSTCGVEIVWSSAISHKITEVSNRDNQTPKYWAIGIAAIIGLVILVGLFSSGGTNQQEECFEREMAKFGAFADPKGWAVKSRLYCQALYP